MKLVGDLETATMMSNLARALVEFVPEHRQLIADKMSLTR
jgi:hypothetical protein